ncbi:hypothetical protein HMPREF9436_00125 [Faecalibacterium cf. prausnitzii KLE1255]|uniref:Uncharacterized protein n=1 Tax=Faecalibacterium cf. prausnitzii KLE1255 TaxID=748224 RepID=E2ZEP6_9FIRM|nr:hypothetical protein HMPREF9436_00125 [Faecalibacterium cf. prausnitzii KLE1255]
MRALPQQSGTLPALPSSAALPKHAATARKTVSEGYYTMKPRKEKALFTNES